jgi:LPS export ABC transporter permease LptG/LPS export ABC transporter permease LptF
MRILSRAIFREVFASATLGTLLFVFVLFLRTIEHLSVLLVRVAAPPAVIGRLLLYALPATVPFALPLGVLVGILVGLSRMSADNEIVAMRAAGVSSATIIRPVFLFSFFAFALTATASLWLTPLCLHLETMVARNFAAAQLTGEIESRIFNEQFPNTVLYVDDVTAAGKQVTWHKVFIADTTPAGELQQQGKNRGEGPRIIVAREAVPHADAVNNRIILDMRDVRSSETDKDGKVITTAAPTQLEVLQAQKQEELQLNKSVQEMDTGPLYKRVYRPGKPLSHEEYVDSAIELHQRFALPLACILLGLVGVPLGISSRKGGRSGAFVITVLIAFIYYLSFITLIGLARKGSLPVPLAVWTPDAVFAVISIVLLSRLEKPGDTDVFRWMQGLMMPLLSWRRVPRARANTAKTPRNYRLFPFRPLLIDAYIVNSFLFYFGVLLTSLLALIEVFTFFELLGDMVKNDIEMTTMLDYLFHLAPKLIYDVTPIGILVSSLICFGILTKHNEVTAFKAGGVSLYRLAAPVLVVSLAISATLFAFDHYYIPEANRRQERLRAEIKRKPVATYLRSDRQWVYGQGSRIYNFHFLDPKSAVMSRVNVYELNPSNFHLINQVSAQRATWDRGAGTWMFQNGMSKEAGSQFDNYRQFFGQSASFPQLTEPPSWFSKEEKEYKEMNFQELGRYISELKASGLETTPLRVQYYKKFAVPLFAFIMAVLSIPFAFLAGNKGTMAGVGISFAIAIAYWSVNTVFEQIGDLNQLPPAMAAWSPDAIFLLAGLYLMARMRT